MVGILCSQSAEAAISWPRKSEAHKIKQHEEAAWSLVGSNQSNRLDWGHMVPESSSQCDAYAPRGISPILAGQASPIGCLSEEADQELARLDSCNSSSHVLVRNPLSRRLMQICSRALCSVVTVLMLGYCYRHGSPAVVLCRHPVSVVQKV